MLEVSFYVLNEQVVVIGVIFSVFGFVYSKSIRAIVKSQGRGFPPVIFIRERRKRRPNEAPRCSAIPRLLIAYNQHFVPLRSSNGVNSDNRHLCEVLSRNNRESSLDSRLDSRFSRGSRIKCQLPFERYCITKLGLAEGEETSKSFKVSFISLAKPQTENDSDTKPRIAHAFETLSKSG